ncbi:MAG: response regulator [Hyphomicrobiales bacterium]|nr:MAG: response regulator [Hyphomicrobiales bacterium]
MLLELPSPPHRGEPSLRHSILVVEDEALLSILIEDILGEAGYEVAIAFDGKEALKQAKSMAFLSGVVTDLNLRHGDDGRSVLRQLRAIYPFLPAVVVTGYNDWTGVADLRGVGGPTARLTKPYRVDNLLACLADVLSSTNGRANHRSSTRSKLTEGRTLNK